jgi:antitoxin (DNA-binding transcriptional repressor) of toxin-antitoxin stability system
MYHMKPTSPVKRASVRDLRYDFPRVERLLAEGEPVEITKRNKVIGKLVPPDTEQKPVQIPDFLGRMKKISGDKVLKVTGAELIRWDRDRGSS